MNDPIVSIKHSFLQENLEINSETRLRELMEYNANRITRETIDKISTALADEWLSKNKTQVLSGIDSKQIVESIHAEIDYRLMRR